MFESRSFCYYLFGVDKFYYIQYILLGLVFYKIISKVFSKKLAFFIAISPVFVFFIRILRNDPFFLSDDFAHIELVSKYSYLEIAKMAIFPPGIWVGHRIISAFWLFKFIYQLFGASPIPFIIAVFLLNLSNVILFYKLLLILGKKKPAALLVTFLFSFMYLSWISNLHELLGAFFVLLGLFFWKSYIDKPSKMIYRVNLGLYILALFSKEITFLYPFALLVVSMMFSKKHNHKLKKELILPLLPFFIIFVLYFLIFTSGFLSYFGINRGVGYNMEISFGTISKNLLYYFSELFPGVKPLISLIGVLVLFALTDIYNKKPTSLLFLSLFFIMLLPALLFSGRTSFYYLYIPSIFFFLGLYFVFLTASEYLKILIKNAFFYRSVVVVVLVLIFFKVFGVGNKLMDECFLIQTPWENDKKQTLLQLKHRLNEQAGNTEYSDTVALSKEEQEKLNEILYLFNEFIKAPDGYEYSYSAGQVTILKQRSI